MPFDPVSYAMGAKSAGGGGGSGGVLVVNEVAGILDKTAEEIMAAAETGQVVIKYNENGFINICPIIQFSHAIGYDFTIFKGDWVEYAASSGSDYPELD